MAVAKCSECGAEVDESASFCENCGAEVTVDESHSVEESHEESQTDEGQGPSYVKWRSGWWSYKGAMATDENGIAIERVETELSDLGWKYYAVGAIAILISQTLNPTVGIVFLAGAFLIGRYVLYGTGGSLHDKKVGGMEESDVFEDPDVRISLSEIEEAKHKSKMFPLLRDMGELSLSTRDGEKYTIHGPDEDLRSVSEMVNG